MTTGPDVFLVYSDPYFLAALNYQFEVLGVTHGSVTDFNEALGILETQQPRMLILEWNLRDLQAIDFLIKISEQKTWGEMQVFFVCDHEMTESEEFQMASLGTHESLLKNNLLVEPHFATFLETVRRACTASSEA